jgi:hypothetical protein
MKAVRLHAYREPPTLDEVAEPEITGPSDVIVRVGGAVRRDRAGGRGRTVPHGPAHA